MAAGLVPSPALVTIRMHLTGCVYCDIQLANSLQQYRGMKTMKTIRTALIGLGNVGRNFLRILEMKEERLRRQYEVAFQVCLVADSSGAAIAPGGFDPATVRAAKEAGKPVRELPGFQPGATPAGLLRELDLHLLLEASPVNLESGEPGLSIVRRALELGIDVVLANKGPLVLAFQELQALAAESGAQMGYSATVCGALPVINFGQRDLIAADVRRLRGIFNSTSNFILSEMAAGRSYDAALAEAQARGIAEADPTLDVEGWDTANKLVIIANSFLGMPATLTDVQVVGITQLTQGDLQAAHRDGEVIKLIATAEPRGDGRYTLRVAPERLPADDFLGSCSSWEMGIEVQSDLYGRMYHKIWEREPLPTAAAMLRDAVNLARS
jgi:homoserine dehydrogenase